MQNESSTVQTADLSEGSGPGPGPARPEALTEEKLLPVADGGLGPLDSDDIEWLIESGRVWLP